MLRKISLGLALIAFIICLSLSFESYGFDAGYELAQKKYENPIGKINFSDHGPRTYEYLAEKYGLITWFLVIFLIGKSLELKSIYKNVGAKILSQTLCFSSLGLILYQIRRLILDKSLVDTAFWNEPYHILFHKSVSFDWIILSIALTLSVIQIIIVSKSFYEKYKATPK